VTIANDVHKRAFYPCAIAKRRNLILPAVLLGVVLLVVAVLYWVDTASSLPSFFPGHDAHSSHHHVKHGIAALVVALACFAFAWFQSGPTREGETTT
jgi:ABC-type transporter Mla subunit MlaD